MLPAIVEAGHVTLQQATATGSQGGFAVGNLINDVYPNGDSAGDGWADDIGGSTNPQTAVFETATDLDLSLGGTVRFNLYQGWSSSHTVGRYRYSYTTDDRSTFADGLANGGDVTANWVPIAPGSVVSSGGATLSVQGDNSILSSGADPNRTTDTVYATLGPVASPVTGFRLETLADASLPTNGPGRANNGNYVARELDVAAFLGEQAALQNGTAQRSQTNFSVDNIIDGTFEPHNANGVGWANSALGSNVATFETLTDVGDSDATLLTIEIMSGGFSASHTLGNFRLTVTDADRSLFADGNDNGGGSVGSEGIWTVLNPISAVTDGAASTLTEDATHALLAGGTPSQIEHYTLTFQTGLSGITGFRLEALEHPSLPFNGPGRAGGNGNFVVREFTVFAMAVPEPTTLLIWSLLAGLGAGLRWRRRK